MRGPSVMVKAGLAGGLTSLHLNHDRLESLYVAPRGGEGYGTYEPTRSRGSGGLVNEISLFQ